MITAHEINAVVIAELPALAVGFRLLPTGRLPQSAEACRAREDMVERLANRFPGITLSQIRDATGLHLEVVKGTLERIAVRKAREAMGEFADASVGYAA